MHSKNELVFGDSWMSTTDIASPGSLEGSVTVEQKPPPPIIVIKFSSKDENWEGEVQHDDDTGENELVDQMNQTYDEEVPSQEVPSSLESPQRGRARKQSFATREEDEVDVAGGKRIKLYELGENDPNIDEGERERRRKAKRDRNFRLKKQSDLEKAETENTALRDQVEEKSSEIERLKNRIKRMEEELEKKDEEIETLNNQVESYMLPRLGFELLI